MPSPTTINLPRSYTAKFPPRCVVCRAHSPDSTVSVWTWSIGWWTWVLLWWGMPVRVKAPACYRCAWRLQFSRFAGVVISGLLIWIMFQFCFEPIKARVPRGLLKYAMLIPGLIAVLPYIVFQTFFPPPFETTAMSDSIDYAFRDEDDAIDFAMINSDAAWVKVEGTPI